MLVIALEERVREHLAETQLPTLQNRHASEASAWRQSIPTSSAFILGTIHASTNRPERGHTSEGTSPHFRSVGDRGGAVRAAWPAPRTMSWWPGGATRASRHSTLVR